MSSVEALRDKLTKSTLEPVHVEIVDTSDGCGSKFEAIIVTPKFIDVPLLERQRNVNEVIKEEMATIHAFTMKTWTPEQWEKKKKASSTP